MTAIALTDSGLRTLKRAFQNHFPSEKSSHITEALAAACGYKTHAALLAAMKAGDTQDPDVVLLDEQAFLGRYETVSGRAFGGGELSFDDMHFGVGADVINTHSLHFSRINYSKSLRKRAWRNAMVAAINAAIERRLLSVRPGDNRWPGANKNGDRDTYVFAFAIEGIPAVASLHDAGYDEVSVHVALWPTPDGERWVSAMNAGFDAGQVFASGWLERRDGAWLQVSSDGATSFRSRRERLAPLAALDIRPKGYADRGSFKL